jgi:hypothetical protein
MNNLGSIGLILVGMGIAYVSVMIALAIVSIGAPETSKDKK